jgi:superfamily I DNA/RNA helicase
MPFQLTDEQIAIVEAATSTRDNLLVVARAGAAKTTTLVEVTKALPRANGLVLAFNKAIADEMKTKLPGNFKAQTLNGCGFQAWQRYIGKRCRVDGRKCYELLRAEIETLPKLDADEAWDLFSETLKAIGQAKLQAYIPKAGLPPAFRPLTSAEDFYNTNLPFEATDLQRMLIDKISSQSFQLAIQGHVDFDDMLLGPAVAGVSFDYYSDVLVDEAQDLSFINHILLKKLRKPGTRIIAVGDPCQAIYGFRGADTSSMETLGEMFQMRELFLTTSFRCASSIVENARWRAPDMRWPDWAKPGLVLRPEAWSADDLPDGAAIICRNNAPLFRMALRLLRDGKYPELLGRDIVKSLLAQMKKLGKAKLTRDEALASLRGWTLAQKQRQREHTLVEDQAECMKIFIDATETLGDAMALAENVMSRSGRIYLMTGHRSKGLEYETVLFLDSALCRIDRDQDANIKYVIETRAKDKLVYVSTDNFRSARDEE